MKFKLNFLLVLVVAMGLVSCENETFGIVGNGDVIEEVRQIEEFKGVVVNGPFKVEIEMSDSDELEISGESNILPHIATEVHDGFLYIEPNYHETIYINKPLKVTVPTRTLEEIELNGAGKVIAPAFLTEDFHLHLRGAGIIDTGVDAENLSVVLSGSGEIEMYGKAKEAEFELEGSGEIDAFDTIIEDCEIEIVGSTDAEVYVTQSLEVEIEGSGSVTYDGNPTRLVTDVDGSGFVREREIENE